MTGNADILRLLLQHRLEEEDEDFDELEDMLLDDEDEVSDEA